MIGAILRYSFIGLSVSIFISQAVAQPKEGAFSTLRGAWSGNGSIAFADGHKERIRCRSDYSPDATGESMKLNLTCASDSYKFELSAEAQSKGGSVSGMWNERTRGLAGNLSGKAIGNTISVNAVGQTFAAMMNIQTRGQSQTVHIQSPGTSISEVTISMTRR